MKYLIAFLVGFILIMLSVNSFAGVDLTQCGINNNLAICSQTTEKIQEREIKQALIKEKETKDTSMSVNEFFNGLVMLVKNQNVDGEIIVKTSFESDEHFQSSLIHDYYSVKYKNGQWRNK